MNAVQMMNLLIILFIAVMVMNNLWRSVRITSDATSIGLETESAVLLKNYRGPKIWNNASVLTTSKPRQEYSIDTKLIGVYTPKCTSQLTSSTPEPDWLSRFPYLALIGAMKGGTKALRSYLGEHPTIATSCGPADNGKEIHFFDIRAALTDQLNRTELQQAYAVRLEKVCQVSVEAIKADLNLVFMDDSPMYLFYSHKVPQTMLCTVPWTKLVAILRNPVERAFSHFVFKYEKCTGKTFEEWIDIEFHLMERAGLLALADGHDSVGELDAWKKYHSAPEMQFKGKQKHTAQCSSFVGRGLYAIQLQHWFAALSAFGRPTTDLMVLSTDSLREQTLQSTYNKLLDFLDLDPHQLKQVSSVHSTNYNNKPILKPETRKRLEDFYRPYNQRLYKLLCWDTSPWA